jgi:ketosteroid isomerase-like protein
MNTKRNLLTLSLSLAILLAACSPAATPVPTDPLTVVQRYYEAIEAKDIDKAMTFAAEDIVLTDPSGVTSGKEAATAAWKGYIDAGFTFDQSDFKATGGRVTSCYKVYQNGALLDQGCNNVTHVRDGKIIFDGLEPAEAVFIVQQVYNALNSKNVDTAMSYVADDAIFANPSGKYVGKAEIRASLEGIIKDGITFEFSNFRAFDGRVVMDYKVKQGDQLLDSGTDGLDIVKNGLIIFDGTERTEASQ